MLSKYNNLSKRIADIISFFPSLLSEIKINTKENENRLDEENLKYYKKQYSMLEIQRKNYLAKKKFETETNLHKTSVLSMLICMLAFISVSITLLGTNVMDNLFKTETVIIIKSVLTISLMFAIMFISYYFSSQLGIIKEKFYILYKIAIVLIVACISVSVYFNFTFLQSILIIDNQVIKFIVALLKSILLDVSLSALLFYRNLRQTLTFTYSHGKTYNETADNIKTENWTEIETEPRTENETEKQKQKPNRKKTYVKKDQTDKTEQKNLSYDEKFKMIENVIESLSDNERIEYNSLTHFLTRYDWDKAKKQLIKDGVIYINNRQCRKKPKSKKLQVVT